jgi:RHS repeat-associated protein
MKTTSFRARSLACALLATTAYCGLSAQPAAAQTTQTTPVRQAIDANGVDVASGQLRTTAPESLGIGGLNFEAGWTGTLDHNSFDMRIVRLGTTNRTVSVAGRTRLYTGGSGTFTPRDADGSTLVETSTGTFTLTQADGTVYYFTPSQVVTNGLTLALSLIDRIVQPNGRTLTFNYRTATFQDCTLSCKTNTRTRVQSLTDNQGHMLKPVYASQSAWVVADQEEDFDFRRIVSVTAIDLSTDYCNPGADICTGLTGTWPKMEFSEAPGGGGSTVETIKDEGGNETDVIRDPNDLVIGVDRPANAGNDSSATYDANKRVATLTKNGLTWTYAYSETATTLTTTATLAGGGSVVTVVDKASSRLLSQTDELSRTTSYQYDTSGRPTRITRPEGNYTQLTYDLRGNVIETRAVAKAGSGFSDIVATASYDASCTVAVKCNQPNSVTDARGNTTDYTYSAVHGGLTRMQLPAPAPGQPRPEVNYTYTPFYGRKKNSSGVLVAETVPVYLITKITRCATAATCPDSAGETVTDISYDSNNLLPTIVKVRAGDNSAFSEFKTAYDAFDRVQTVDGPMIGTKDTTRYYYDAAGRLRGEIGPDPDDTGTLLHRAVRYSYDADDRPTKTERGTATSQADGAIESIAVLETVDSAYDANGRPVTQMLSAGGTIYALTQASYDALGRPECVAQRMNPGTYAALPASACTLGTAGTFGPDRISKTLYDAAGQVTQVKSALGTTDEANEVTATYRSNGQVETVTDGENNKTTYVFDGHDRLLQTQFPSATKGAATSNSADYEQLSYDAGSNVTSFRNRANETIGFTFDALNRMTLKDLPGSEPDVTYTYDLAGRMTGASQTGNALSFTYDALGRNLTQTGPHGTVTSAFNLVGRRLRITHPDGFYVTQDYLVTGEMKSIRENGAASGVGVLATFAYDDLGRRTSLTRGNGTSSTYTFDAVSRLASLVDNPAGTTHDQTLGFGYNPAGQITSNTRSNDLFAWAGHGSGTTASTANGLNQLATIGGTTTAHDARGNMTADGLGKTFGYSSENLLTGASGGVTLAYDPALRLYQVAGATTTKFAYDGADLIAEYNASNALQRRFVHGPSMDEPLVWYEGAGTTDRRFLHADERGSVVAVSDSTGAVINVNAYDEYGKPGAGNVGRFQYTGQKWIAELALYDYKARMYHPNLGRFLQADPIGYGDGMNVYAYVGGDPVNLVDPLGLQDEPNDDADGDGLPDPDIVVTGRLGSSSCGMFCRIGRAIGIGSGGSNKGRPGDAVPPACPANKSLLASIANGADKVGDVADGVAVGSAMLGIVTAPTGAGFVIFEGTAIVAAGTGRVASVVSILANAADGNYRKAGSGFAGLVGGHFVGKAVSKVATSAYARNRMFNDLSAGQTRRVKLYSETGSAAGTRITSRIVC